MKHPGPWKRGDSDDGTWFSVVDASGGIVSDDFNCDQEAEALILAAPELLEALKSALKLIHQEVAERDHVEIPIRALIARIEGK